MDRAVSVMNNKRNYSRHDSCYIKILVPSTTSLKYIYTQLQYQHFQIRILPLKRANQHLENFSHHTTSASRTGINLENTKTTSRMLNNTTRTLEHRQEILHKLHLHATTHTNIISPQFSPYLYTAKLYQQKIQNHRMRLTFYP
jgi:hypothetical protein